VVCNIGNSNVSPPEAGSVAVLLGNGDGTFQDAVQYTPFQFPGWVAVGDFNGDGLPDLAVTRVQDGHSVNVMLNQGGAGSGEGNSGGSAGFLDLPTVLSWSVHATNPDRLGDGSRGSAATTVGPAAALAEETPLRLRARHAWAVSDNTSSLGHRFAHVDLQGALERLDPAVLDEAATKLLV
jgi:hypothetical protein